jgi:hypothetical protein
VGLKILMVDDQPENIEPLRAELAMLEDTTTLIVGFGEFHAAMRDFGPNIIVLDLAQGAPAEGISPGIGIFDEIWTHRFCPLVVYTAVPELISEDPRLPHPFVKLQQKGAGSEEGVIECIREFGPHVSALDEAGREIARALNKALKDVAPRVFESVTEVSQQKEMLIRSARRRVAAAMDQELSTGGPNLRSWEHYLCPPMIDHLLTGDLIVRRAASPPNASDYAVVLTPSCDLARKPKVESVLVASCTDVGKLLEDLNAKEAAKGKIKSKLKSLLAEGYGRSCLPLAGLPGVFPAMAADFQRLKLIPLNQVGEDGEYARVASVDHPFRGLVAWAYMANAGRPGLPERDLESWVAEISDELDPPKTKASASAAAAETASPVAAAETGIAEAAPAVSEKNIINADTGKVTGKDKNAGD